MFLAYMDCFGGLSSLTLLNALVGAGAAKREVERALPRQTGRSANGHAAHTGVEAWMRAAERSFLPPVVKETTIAVYKRLLSAEKGVHEAGPGILRVVGSHEWDPAELGAVAGVVYALSILGVERIECSPLQVGGGAAGTNGSKLKPSLSPITAELLRSASIPVFGGIQRAELITPVGVGLVATLASNFGPLPLMTIKGIGYGNDGERGEPPLRHTRVLVGEPVSQALFDAKERPPSQLEPGSTAGSGAPLPTAPLPADVPRPYVSALEEWVRLSIEGHQQSGRQRA